MKSKIWFSSSKTFFKWNKLRENVEQLSDTTRQEVVKATFPLLVIRPCLTFFFKIVIYRTILIAGRNERIFQVITQIHTHTDTHGHFRSSCNHLGRTASYPQRSTPGNIQKVKLVECARYSFPHIQWNKTAFRLSQKEKKKRTHVDFLLLLLLF